MAKKETVVVAVKTYVGGKLVDESAQVVKPNPDWLSIAISVVVFLAGAYHIIWR